MSIKRAIKRTAPVEGGGGSPLPPIEPEVHIEIPAVGSGSFALPFLADVPSGETLTVILPDAFPFNGLRYL